MRFKKSTSILLSAALVLGAIAINPTTSEAATTAQILAGSNRHSTAIQVSKKGWSSAENVVLVNDSAIADALAATPLAEELNAPILLTGKGKLNRETKSEISRLGAKNVYLIGGKSVLSDDLASEIKGNTYRISGNSREETALAIAKKIQELKPIKSIAVVNGKTGLADAVSIAAVAAEKDMAIILSNAKSGVQDSADFINSIGVEKSYIIGGNKAVSNSIMATLPGAERVSGSNRSDTNAKVIEKFYPNASLNNLYVAKNGSKGEGHLIDALAVGVLAAKNNSPVLIVSNSLSNSQRNVVKTKNMSVITRVGGNGNENAFEEIKVLKGMKPAELKLPSSAMGIWYGAYKAYDENGEENNFYSYRDIATISKDYMTFASIGKCKYKITKVDGNKYYYNIDYPEEWGGPDKEMLVLNNNSVTFYYMENGKYIKGNTLSRTLTLPNYVYRNYYRGNKASMSIDKKYIKIFGKKYSYTTHCFRYPGYNDFILKSKDNGKTIYFYVHQWGNKVAVYYAYEKDFHNLSPEISKWKGIANFAVDPCPVDILGGVDHILPGMRV